MDRIMEKLFAAILGLLLAIPLWLFPNSSFLRDFYDVMTFSRSNAAEQFVDAVNAQDVDALMDLLSPAVKLREGTGLQQKITGLYDAIGQKLDPASRNFPYGSIYYDKDTVMKLSIDKGTAKYDLYVYWNIYTTDARGKGIVAIMLYDTGNNMEKLIDIKADAAISVYFLWDKVVDIVNAKDVDALLAMMSPYLKANVENLPEKIQELYDAIPVGARIPFQYADYGGMGGNAYECFWWHFKFKDGAIDYQLFIDYYVQYDFPLELSRVGISRLGLSKREASENELLVLIAAGG